VPAAPQVSQEHDHSLHRIRSDSASFVWDNSIRYLFIRTRRAPMLELVFPILAIIVVGYTLYKNVHGVPFPYSRFPFYVAGWLVVGLLIVLLWPGLSARIGATMAQQEGISEGDAPAAGS
jgi:hypothetical protein